MQEIKCNIFKECKSNDAICVTTNGCIKSDGKLVMGAGVAKDFRDMFKGIDTKLGKYVKEYGNRVFNAGKVTIKVDEKSSKVVTAISFPTKYDWKDKSDLALIEQSCVQLKQVAEKFKIEGNIYLPAPGCSNGGLDWTKDVKPIIEKHLTEDKYKICFKK